MFEFIPLSEFIPKFALFVGLAVAFDTIARQEPKEVIFKFISKAAHIRFAEFESQIINTLIDAFLNSDKRVSPLRVGIYSCVGALVMTLIFLIGRSNNYIFPDRPMDLSNWRLLVLTTLLVGFLSAYLSFLSDLISLNITKSFFYGRRRSVLSLIWRWIADFTLSVVITFLPLLIIYLGTIYFMRGREAALLAEASGPLWYGTLLSVTLSTFVSSLQLLFILFGIATRITLGNAVLALRQLIRFVDIQKFPISFITVYWCFMGYVMRNLIALGAYLLPKLTG